MAIISTKPDKYAKCIGCGSDKFKLTEYQFFTDISRKTCITLCEYCVKHLQRMSMKQEIKRLDKENKITGGYRTIISNGENHFCIDTCFTDDYGNESMVFMCDENGQVTDWSDLDCRRYFDDSEMENVHNEMVQKWIDKLEKGNI